MKKQQIIEAMNGYVVEMTEKRAKKARKLIEGKGMKVDNIRFKYYISSKPYLRFSSMGQNFWIGAKGDNERIMPWKQFKSMFQKKKKRGIEIITFGIDFGVIGSGLNTKNHLSDAFDYLMLKRMQPSNAEKFENGTTDTAKRHFKLCKDQTIKFD